MNEVALSGRKAISMECIPLFLIRIGAFGSLPLLLRVTLEQVNAAAAQHVRVDDLVVARGLPAT